ncbi:MAG: chemotaxis protein CheW [Nitrospirae bacterium CG17_big_fil_post_rev_8_21_14_2_50_50_9]|nr:MAG: chemotaxis protein CheW [Nitrospirae bacterium CG17_big_fil_post_rev_8_21_14_2_50_50_9]PIW86124.1 MAG: chemotaxis protein CheW [Nitrospirae bacterium CG_4_8_14_3_um_filter_50_41]
MKAADSRTVLEGIMTGDLLKEKAEEVSWIQLVTFFVHREEYALDIRSAQEILRIPEVTRVPKTPFFLMGVMNLRGKIIPIVDLRKRLGISSSAPSPEDSRVIVVNDDGKVAGLAVDSMSQVLRIEASSIDPVPSFFESQSPAEFIHGVIRLNGRLLIVLDLKILLSDPI